MAFRDAVSRLLGRKNLEIRSVVTTADIMGMSPSELYRTQPALRAVVSFLADNTAHLPLKCYIRQGDNDRPRDTKSTLALLMSNPSVAMTEHEILRATASDYYLYGYALWLLLPSNKTLSGWSITSIPVSWIESTFTLDGIEPSSYTVVNPETKKRVQLQAEDCIRFYAYDPDGPTAARSPVESLKQILSEQISAWNFRNGVWKNGGRVSAYLTRPANAPDWVSNGGRDRFARSWKAKFSGENGTDTGGTPLLEDGMELKAIQFNAREAEWTEATRLAREDVAAIYHINPLLVWPTSSSGAYSNAGDLARSLYVDTMGPFLNMVEERINHVLIPKLELDQSHYVEFDLDAKLQGDFKERASVIQSSTGGPWLTRNEARAWMNLPAIPGGDELIVPLNVIEGGLASPNDTDPTRERYNSSKVQPIKASTEYAVLECDDVCPCMKSLSAGDADPKDEELRFKSSPSKKDEDALDAVLKQFYERQGKSVANRIQNTPTEDLGMHYQGEISWWQSDRWDKELAEDLSKYGIRQAIDAAKKSLSILDVDAGNLDESKIEEYARVICESRAHDINWNSLQRIFSRFEKLGDGLTPLAAAEAVREDFKRLADSRAERNARSIATAIANYGTVEGAKQSGYECMKMWVVGSLNPRRTHSRMMGQRVKLDDRFSNGARWPGDPGLPPEETCNCCCRIEIIKGKNNTQIKYDEIINRYDLSEQEKELAKVAINDANTSLSRSDSIQYADAISACFKKAEYIFKHSDISEEGYKATIGKLLEMFSDIYQMDISGQYMEGKGLSSAVPNGDELWAVTRLRELCKKIEFQGFSNRRSANPDIIIDGVFADIKTPKKSNKVRTRLSHAKEQCSAMGQDTAFAILSGLRVEDDFYDTLIVAQDFLDDGTFASIYVVDPDIKSYIMYAE